MSITPTPGRPRLPPRQRGAPLSAQLALCPATALLPGPLASAPWPPGTLTSLLTSGKGQGAHVDTSLYHLERYNK